MLTNALIKALDSARSPRAVRASVWALEKVTGYRSDNLLQKSISVDGINLSGDLSDWYRNNGYYRIGQLGGSYSSFSGISISAEAAMEGMAFYSCGKVIGEDMGALPCFTYQRDRDEFLRKATEHSLYGVLHDAANPYTNAGSFFESLTFQSLVFGNGYALKGRANDGRIIALWPLKSCRVERKETIDGEPYYLYTRRDWTKKLIPYADMFDLPSFCIGDDGGDPLLIRARHALGLLLAAQEYAGRFFANDASPGIILQRPLEAESLDPDTIAELKKAWKRWHQGRDRAHEPAILQDGMTAHRVDPDHTKLQLHETRQFQLLEMCRATRVPPHKIADLSRATHSNIEESDIAYIQDVLNIWSNRWRQSSYRCLFTPDERADGYYSEHNVAAYQKGRFRDQAEAWSMLLEKGVYCIDDIREFQNMNPIPGGKKHLVQVNRQDITADTTQASQGVVQ